MAKKLLIADDDVDLVNVLSLRCRRPGLHVAKAFDGISTLQMVQQYEPDLILMDVGMPCGNGLTVCEMIVTEPRWAGIPVVMLTGRNDQSTIRRCRELNAYYVQKGAGMWDRLEPVILELIHLEGPRPPWFSRCAPDVDLAPDAVAETTVIDETMRQWNDRQGNLLIIGEFIEQDDEQVLIGNGHSVTAVPIRRLSFPDRKFVRREMRNRQQTETAAETQESAAAGA